MKKQITIEGFKRIENVVLSDFSTTNYLVGKNGSGKSSFLNALSFLNDTSGVAVFFGKDSQVNFKIDSKVRYLEWNEEHPSKVSISGDLSVGIHILANEKYVEKGTNGIALANGTEYSELNTASGKKTFARLNDTLKSLGEKEIEIGTFVRDPWDTQNIRVFKQDGKDINPIFVASGVRSLNDLRLGLEGCVRRINAMTDDVYLILIEEPETHLHPDLQKEIPSLIKSYLDQCNPEKMEKVFLFISTHSPFIISSAIGLDQNVYLFENGAILPTKSSKSEKISIISQMLGADVTDLGYPENYCIVEESSLQYILQDAANKGLIKNIQFVSSRGWSVAVSLSERIFSIESISTLVKCNPYYFDKFLLILDNTSDFSGKEQKRIEAIKVKLKDRFKELSKKQIEEYYQNLDVEIHKKFFSSNKTSDDKKTFSIQISEKVRTVEDFNTLFDGELNLLV